MMENNVDARSLGIGVLVGVVAGLAVGLLFAPQSGRETREMISERFNEVKEKIGEVGEKVKGRFPHKAGVACEGSEGE